MTQRYYIATGLENVALHKEVRTAIDALGGFELTYDWTTHGSLKDTSQGRLTQGAIAERQGVMDADFLVVILPGGKGTHTELGMALGQDKDIYVLDMEGDIITWEPGKSTCLFYWHPNVRDYVTLEGLLASLKMRKHLLGPSSIGRFVHIDDEIFQPDPLACPEENLDENGELGGILLGVSRRSALVKFVKTEGFCQVRTIPIGSIYRIRGLASDEGWNQVSYAGDVQEADVEVPKPEPAPSPEPAPTVSPEKAEPSRRDLANKRSRDAFRIGTNRRPIGDDLTPEDLDDIWAVLTGRTEEIPSDSRIPGWYGDKPHQIFYRMICRLSRAEARLRLAEEHLAALDQTPW